MSQKGSICWKSVQRRRMLGWKSNNHRHQSCSTMINLIMFSFSSSSFIQIVSVFITSNSCYQRKYISFSISDDTNDAHAVCREMLHLRSSNIIKISEFSTEKHIKRSLCSQLTNMVNLMFQSMLLYFFSLRLLTDIWAAQD